MSQLTLGLFSGVEVDCEVGDRVTIRSRGNTIEGEVIAVLVPEKVFFVREGEEPKLDKTHRYQEREPETYHEQNGSQFYKYFEFDDGSIPECKIYEVEMNQATWGFYPANAILEKE